MTSPSQKSSKAMTFLKRSGSTLGLWAVVAAAFASRLDWAYVSLIGVLVVLATVEYLRMISGAAIRGFPALLLGGAVGYSAALYFFLLGCEVPAWLDPLAIFAMVAGAFVVQLRRPVEGAGTMVAVAMHAFGFLYVAFLFNFAARLVFAVPGPGEVPGAMLLLWGIAVTKFTDMGAYLVGSWIGRHKMIPHISPGKTWQGFGGALFFALLAGCGLYALCGEDMPGFSRGLHLLGGWGAVIVLSLVLSLAAVVGDLAESVLKRSLSVKDSGHVLPGIGGALDLIDSLCFTLPILYFYVSWMSVG
jgi:phosphatidate cytidylyltransferase